MMLLEPDEYRLVIVWGLRMLALGGALFHPVGILEEQLYWNPDGWRVSC
jgi:hypothetical protein